MQEMRRSFAQVMSTIGLTALIPAVALAISFAPVSARAQQPGAPADSAKVIATPLAEAPPELREAIKQSEGKKESVDFITPHITDSHHLELPWFNHEGAIEVDLPQYPPVMIGGMAFDFSPTKHVVFLLLAATIAAVLLIGAASVSQRDHANGGHSKGFAGGMEAMALYLRNEVVLPNVGHHGEKFVPFALTLFFFILCCNLLGLIPYGSTATGNVSVTATLAIITLIVVEVAGMRANGLGYLSTIFYWNKDLPMVMRVIMFFVMSPVEMVGKLSKPFALTIRLFANMTAGHIVLLAIIGLIFTFQSWAITGVPVVMAVAISVLELFVSFLQAFIFTLLACVFIGQIREAHH